MVDLLANDFASQPVVFLEYNVNSPPPKRYDRWWAAFGGSTAYYPMVMVNSGHQVKSGYTADLYNIYKGMVDAELARAPLADIEAYSWRVDNHVKFSGQMTNRSGQTLSTVRNDATLHALVYEDAHVGVTNRFVRAVVSQPISADLLSGSSISFDLETPDLTGVNWTKLHMLVLADYRPNGSSGAYDMLQAALTISPTSCAYTISPTSSLFSSSGNTGMVTVTTSSSSCSWTAVSNAPWITITAGSTGTGNGTVSYSVSDNTAGRTRRGTMTIGGKTFTVTQKGDQKLGLPWLLLLLGN